MPPAERLKLSKEITGKGAHKSAAVESDVTVTSSAKRPDGAPHPSDIDSEATEIVGRTIGRYARLSKEKITEKMQSLIGSLKATEERTRAKTLELCDFIYSLGYMGDELVKRFPEFEKTAATWNHMRNAGKTRDAIRIKLLPFIENGDINPDSLINPDGPKNQDWRDFPNACLDYSDVKKIAVKRVTGNQGKKISRMYAQGYTLDEIKSANKKSFQTADKSGPNTKKLVEDFFTLIHDRASAGKDLFQGDEIEMIKSLGNAWVTAENTAQHLWSPSPQGDGYAAIYKPESGTLLGEFNASMKKFARQESAALFGLENQIEAEIVAERKAAAEEAKASK